MATVTNIAGEWAINDRARPVQLDLLRVAHQHDVPVEIFVLAAADAIATAAAIHDRDHGGAASLSDRLHSLIQRIEQTYARVRRQRG